MISLSKLTQCLLWCCLFSLYSQLTIAQDASTLDRKKGEFQLADFSLDNPLLRVIEYRVLSTNGNQPVVQNLLTDYVPKKKAPGMIQVGLRLKSLSSSRQKLRIQSEAFVQNDKQHNIRPLNRKAGSTEIKWQGSSVESFWQYDLEKWGALDTLFVNHYRNLDGETSESLLSTGVGINYKLALPGKQKFELDSGFTNLAFTSESPREELGSISQNSVYLSLSDSVRLNRYLNGKAQFKFERNSQNAMQFTPKVRLNISLKQKHSFWLSASRSQDASTDSTNAATAMLGFVPLNTLAISPQARKLVQAGNSTSVVDFRQSMEAGWQFRVSSSSRVQLSVFNSLFEGMQGIDYSNSHCLPNPDCSGRTEYFYRTSSANKTTDRDASGVKTGYRWQADKVIALSADFTVSNTRISRKQVFIDKPAQIRESETLQARLQLKMNWQISPNSEFSVRYSRTDIPNLYTEQNLGVLNLSYEWAIKDSFTLGVTVRDVLNKSTASRKKVPTSRLVNAPYQLKFSLAI